MSNICFLICSFVYIMLVAIIYFSKKRLDTPENKIFSKIIIANIIGVVLDFISVYMAFSGFHNLLFNFVNKLYLVYLLTWISLFTVYTIVISFNSEKTKIFSKIIQVLYIPIMFVVISFNLHTSIDGTDFFTYGTGASIMYGVSALYVLIMIICLLINFKNILQKKYLPIFVYIFIGSVATLIQVTNPSILIITMMETFVTILMFFTIENPDLRLIEQLNIARDQAEKANNAKSEFLSNMSHEIRTPLNAIVGFSQALIEEDIPASAKEEVKDIVSASQSLLEIVNGILDISKIEAGKLEIVNTEYNFNNILKDLVSLTKARMGAKQLEFRVNFDPTIPAVLYGDHVRVKQVILNLLTNAVKYTKEGYVEFKVSSIKKDGICRLIISVEDSGIGIKEDKIDKLFSKFERLDIEKNNTIEGTGLGLAITKRLIELMNGKIVVQSVYGKGSRFTIAIDQKIISDIPLKVEQEEISDEIIDCSNKKIMIVDDNKLNLKVASRLLEKYKCQIETLDNGFDLIEKIKNNEHFDLILLDDMMPRMSGSETLQKLKELDNYNIPTVALTANAIAGMKEKYLNQGFNDYLSKPIDKSELNRVINEFLN